LALAWLLHYGKEGETMPRRLFGSFWQALYSERQHDRWSAVNAAVNAIYLAHGRLAIPIASRLTTQALLEVSDKLDARFGSERMPG
jgi:hypothetical protein